MRIKLDENISRHLKIPLEKFGHDVDTVIEEGLLSKIEQCVVIVEPSRVRIRS